jgi:hypothetical protein
MATELSRTFDLPHGRIVVMVEDALSNISSHSIYVSGPQGVSNVEAAIAQILTDTDIACAAIEAAFTAAGWAPNGS